MTIVGHTATIGAGEFVQASGVWVNDRTHGLQFKAGFLKASPPTTLESIERYLGSGMIRGIGPARATRIVAGWAAQKVIREIMLFLHAHGVGTSHAVRIYKTGTVRLTVPPCQRRMAAAWRTVLAQDEGRQSAYLASHDPHVPVRSVVGA